MSSKVLVSAALVAALLVGTNAQLGPPPIVPGPGNPAIVAQAGSALAGVLGGGNNQQQGLFGQQLPQQPGLVNNAVGFNSNPQQPVQQQQQQVNGNNDQLIGMKLLEGFGSLLSQASQPQQSNNNANFIPINTGQQQQQHQQQQPQQLQQQGQQPAQIQQQAQLLQQVQQQQQPQIQQQAQMHQQAQGQIQPQQQPTNVAIDQNNLNSINAVFNNLATLGNQLLPNQQQQQPIGLNQPQLQPIGLGQPQPIGLAPGPQPTVNLFNMPHNHIFNTQQVPLAPGLAPIPPIEGVIGSIGAAGTGAFGGVNQAVNQALGSLGVTAQTGPGNLLGNQFNNGPQQALPNLNLFSGPQLPGTGPSQPQNPLNALSGLGLGQPTGLPSANPLQAAPGPQAIGLGVPPVASFGVLSLPVRQ